MFLIKKKKKETEAQANSNSYENCPSDNFKEIKRMVRPGNIYT